MKKVTKVTAGYKSFVTEEPPEEPPKNAALSTP